MCVCVYLQLHVPLYSPLSSRQPWCSSFSLSRVTQTCPFLQPPAVTTAISSVPASLTWRLARRHHRPLLSPRQSAMAARSKRLEGWGGRGVCVWCVWCVVCVVCVWCVPKGV